MRRPLSLYIAPVTESFIPHQRLSHPMNSLNPDYVLFEDNHLLVVDKPALCVTQGASPSQPSLLRQAQHYLKQKYNKPGNVYLGVVSRLDKTVTGAIVLARTSKAASRLNEQFRQRQVTKIYHALIPQPLSADSIQLVDYLRKNDARHRMEICQKTDSGAKQAVMSLNVLHSYQDMVHVQLQLETGRKHQIRVQLAHQGSPVAGDRKYGSNIPFQPGIALHSKTLGLKHPVKDQWLEFEAPLPKSWKSWMI